jgi:acetyl esterase/lipase
MMMISKKTYTFKVAGNCKIQADVYRASSDIVRPAIVWIHSGGLIMGHRGYISPEQVELYVRAGYTLVSIDYRLAPETKLKAIIEDIQDAYKWVCEKGAELFHIDADRIAIIGHSAGGYLALISGFRVALQPKALVSFYGFGDITATWQTKPSPFYCQQPLVSEEKACKVVGGSVVSSTPGQHNRNLFYLYCRQQGLWPKAVTGHDPDTEPGVFEPFCPIRNVTPEFPPTLLLHGDKDTDVPYEQSVMMAEELACIGIEHELITIPNSGHGFDFAGIKNPVVVEAFQQVLRFLGRYIQ